MNKLLKRGVMGIAALAVPAGALMALPMAANAAPAGTGGTVMATTHSSNHPDTGVSNSCTGSSGDVWAYDNLSLKFIAVQDGTNTYSVTINANGSSAAFADPQTGACYTGTGSVNGTINYEVFSSTPPSVKNLPAQEPGNATMSGDMLQALFGGTTAQPHATITGGGSYSYTYTGIPSAPGGVYTQNG